MTKVSNWSREKTPFWFFGASLSLVAPPPSATWYVFVMATGRFFDAFHQVCHPAGRFWPTESMEAPSTTPLVFFFLFSPPQPGPPPPYSPSFFFFCQNNSLFFFFLLLLNFLWPHHGGSRHPEHTCGGSSRAPKSEYLRTFLSDPVPLFCLHSDRPRSTPLPGP